MGFPFGTRGAGYGLDAELCRKQAAKYDPRLEIEVQQWIESVTGESFTQSFADHLKSGVTLVKLINKIQPGSVARIETSSMPFKQMENISNFLKACRRLGMADYDCFETVDLFEQKDMGVVVICLQALRRMAQSGRADATQKPRRFTPEFGRNGAVPMLNNGSAGIMDRAPVSRSNDITFGRDAGGSCLGADASVPMLNNGSAGIMDRAPVSRSNDITFGRDAGGRGYGADASVPMLNNGSAGIMDRAPVSRSNDITFGRDAGGRGYDADASVPMLNNGSAGIMDRAPVSRSNDITFGRDAGGRGYGADASVPMLNNGSAGIMDRAPVSRSNDITFGRDAGDGRYTTTGGSGGRGAPTKFCTGCGGMLSPAGKFCQGCGTKK